MRERERERERERDAAGQNKNPNPPVSQSLTHTHTHIHSQLQNNRELANHLDKAQEDMSPLRVYELFKKITDEDAVVLWLNPK